MFSEGDAVCAQQILDRILTEYPESPQAQRAKELQEMTAMIQAPTEPYSKSKPDIADGCVIAFFRILAALIGIAFIAAVVAEGTSIELTWRTIAKGSLLLAGGLAFLDIGLSGGRFFFAPVVLAINRVMIGKFRYFLYGLALGVFVSVVILAAIGEVEMFYGLFSGGWMDFVMSEFAFVATVVLALVLLDYFFPPKK